MKRKAWSTASRPLHREMRRTGLQRRSLGVAMLVLISACGDPPTSPDPHDHDPGETPVLGSIGITAEASATSIAVGETVQLTAAAKDTKGGDMSVTFTWTTSNQQVATVDAQGLVTSKGSGQVTITAASGAKQGTIQLGVAGSVHQVDITASQTWKAADNPHFVRRSISVGGAGTAVLTIEAGVVVKMTPGTSLTIGDGASAELQVNGTAASPVTFTSAAATPASGDWEAIVFRSQASSASAISHTVIEDCGGDAGSTAACIEFPYNGNTTQSVKMVNVTVRNSAGRGIQMTDNAHFGAGSSNVTVQNAAGYPISIAANQVSTVPSGSTFTGNVRNMIRVEAGNVATTQTWANLGVPYLMDGEIDIDGAATPMLTLSAGSVLRFTAGGSLWVGDNAAGGLIVNGTAASPVLFTADAATPTAGHWRGINFTLKASSSSVVNFATVEYCGGSLSAGAACIIVTGSGDTGPAVTLKNVTVKASSAMGVLARNGGSFGAGSTSVSVQNAATYPLTVDAQFAGTLPTGGTFTGNGVNFVNVTDDEIKSSETWPNLGIPYLVSSDIEIEGLQNPILTLVPGTEVRFTSGGAFTVGWSFDGGLRALGTAAAPILFTANAPIPAPGHWAGITLMPRTNSTLLDHVVIEFGGAGSDAMAANLMIAKDIGAVLTNSIIRKSSHCGVTRRPETWTTDFTAAIHNNTFTGNVANQCGP